MKYVTTKFQSHIVKNPKLEKWSPMITQLKHVDLPISALPSILLSTLKISWSFSLSSINEDDKMKWVMTLLMLTEPQKHSRSASGGELTANTHCCRASKTQWEEMRDKWQVISHIDWNSAHIYSSFDMNRLVLVLKTQKLWDLILTFKGAFLEFSCFPTAAGYWYIITLWKNLSIPMRIRNEIHHCISWVE